MSILKRELVAQMDRVHILHRIFIQREAAGAGLYFGQMPILEYVLGHDRCTQKEAADYLQISPPSVATSVKRMQKTGLITKTGDASDLRYNRLSVTPTGRERAKECRERFDRVDDRMFAGFSEGDCAALMGFLGRMAENLAEEEFRGKSMFSLLAQMEEFHGRPRCGAKNSDRKEEDD